jgi:hypothetical protein
VRPPAIHPTSGTGNLSAARVLVTPRHVPAPAQALSTPVTLHYLRNSPIRLRGAVSGRHYDFSNSRPTQSVDRRDLPGLLRAGFFRQV